MFAKGFAALALVAVVGLAACSASSHDTPTVSLRQPFNQHEPPAVAKAQFEQAVKKDPRDMYAWYNLAVIAEGEKDPRTAATDYERAIAIKPDFESALFNFGIIRMHARDYPEAVSLLHRAAAANPKDANALFYLGLALANLHTAAADAWSKAEFASARKIDPGLFKGRLYGSGAATSTTRGR